MADDLENRGDRDDSDEPIAAELDRNLWLCPDCGSLYIVNWMVFPEDQDGCDECWPTVRGATTEAVALELTGWSEERLLREAYVVATEVDRMHPQWGAGPFVAEVERRLGIRPPVPGEGAMDQTTVKRVSKALKLFQRNALPAAPIVDEARVLAEHHLLQRSWGGPDLWSGSLAEITDILSRNLERDTKRPAYRGIIVYVVADQYCAQVVSRVGGEGRAYRVWRTPDRLWFFGSRRDTFR